MKVLLCFTLAISANAWAFLITNGDFESGNSGFSSDYTFESPTAGEARYSIISANPAPWDITFGALADHTTGSGNYMGINGSENSLQAFWSQSIHLVEGVTYTFSGYIANMTRSPLPTIELRLFGDTFAGNTYTLTNETLEWNFFSFSWTSGFTGTTPMSLHETTEVLDGNDFGIDDLLLVPEPSSGVLSGILMLTALPFLAFRYLKHRQI